MNYRELPDVELANALVGQKTYPKFVRQVKVDWLDYCVFALNGVHHGRCLMCAFLETRFDLDAKRARINKIADRLDAALNGQDSRLHHIDLFRLVEELRA